MKTLTIITLILAVFFSSVTVQAHPGGTNSSGCHVCRTNCAQYGLRPGQYHCHNSSIVPPRAPSTPSTRPTPSTPSSPSSSSPSSSSTGNYSSIIAIIAVGIVGLIVVLTIKNNSSSPIDNSKFNKGIEDLRSKIEDKSGK
jgi:hypothetical protein